MVSSRLGQVAAADTKKNPARRAMPGRRSMQQKSKIEICLQANYINACPNHRPTKTQNCENFHGFAHGELSFVERGRYISRLWKRTLCSLS
jgi:hypothetical protein